MSRLDPTPSLLFIHGFPLSGRAWGSQIEASRKDRRVFAPDLRGFGESGPRADGSPIAMDRFAEDLRELLVREGVPPAILVGHSMGGYIALAFARRFPEEVAGLALVATRAGADAPEGAAKRREMAEKAMREGPDAILDAMAPKMLSPRNRRPEAVREVRDLMRGAGREGVASALLGMAERSDATALLAEIRVPTLVITGADDVLIPPAESKKMARAIPHARLAILPKAGHLVAWEQPEPFNRTLANWLNGADFRRGGDRPTPR